MGREFVWFYENYKVHLELYLNDWKCVMKTRKLSFKGRWNLKLLIIQTVECDVSEWSSAVKMNAEQEKKDWRKLILNALPGLSLWPIIAVLLKYLYHFSWNMNRWISPEIGDYYLSLFLVSMSIRQSVMSASYHISQQDKDVKY